MSTFLFLVTSGAAGLVFVHGIWWTILSLVAIPPVRQRPLRRGRRWRFAVIVPAHNEELLLPRCLASLKDDQTVHTVEPVVVADNCSDGTADVARAYGVTLLERFSQEERGKSYALQFALHHLATRARPPDAVVVLDGDSHVAPGFFDAIAARLERGAAVVQAHYMADDAEGTLPALRRLALGLVHYARPLGASRLGLGTSLKGNGMAFRMEHAHLALSANGLAEDTAATLMLARANVPVTFEPRAAVRGPMARSFEQSETQDRRWEGGRLGLVPRALGVALRLAVRGRFGAAHGALECGALPLSLLVALSAVALVSGFAGPGPVLLAAAAPLSLLAYLAAGFTASRPPIRDLLALRAAPLFFAYKMRVFVGLLRRRQVTWDRTAR